MKFIRYIVVQGIAYGLDMGVFLLTLIFFGAGPIVANVFSKIVAGCFAFLAHRSFTFGVAQDGRNPRQALMYFLLLALNVPFSSAMLSVLLLNVSHPILAKFIADVIGVAITYWISKIFVFPRRSKCATQPVHQRSSST